MSSLHDMCGKNKQIGPWEEKNNPAALGCVLEAGAEIWLFLKGAVIHNFHMTYTYIYIYLHIDYTRMWQYVYIYIMTWIKWYTYPGICSYIYVIFRHVTSQLTPWWHSDRFSGCSDIDWMKLGASQYFFAPKNGDVNLAKCVCVCVCLYRTDSWSVEPFETIILSYS